MNKTIGILAHVDAGKTTFAEQVLYNTNSIKNRGRVDHKNAFLDSHNIEKDRGITVFSDQGIFSYNNSKYYLIDTPGHVDFSPEMERSIEIMDYAILIISGVEGIQGHTETVWQLLRKHKVPTFFFINKIDRELANVENVLGEMKNNFSPNICFITESFNNGEMDPELIEFIAERDELIFDKYLDGGYEKHLWLKCMRSMIAENKIFPCLSGSALQNIGIDNFIEKLDVLTSTDYSNDGEFSGRVYKIHYDEHGNRVTYIKALSGSLKVRDEINLGTYENSFCEKINQIRIYNGSMFKPVDKVSAGEIFGVIGLSNAAVGAGTKGLREKYNYEMIPTLKAKVIFDVTLNAKEIFNYFKILEAEDPSLNITWEESLREIEVNIMGVVQLEVLKKLVEQRFNVNVDFGPCEILYKETMAGEVNGCGHFEPLGHYAEVHLKLEAAERNSGIAFNNLCHADDLTIGNQNLVRTHIFEREHRGILTGSPITDIKITLLTGRAHNKHTSGGDFREATYRALRQGLEKAKNVQLEPYYRFKIEVEIEYMGKILSDIQKLNGSFDPPKITYNKVNITGRGPVYTFMNYGMEFVSATKGKGKISFIFDGYDICHNEEEVIKKLSYNKNADINNTSTSIFCSKGQAFLVVGDEAEDYMHCLK